MPLNDKQLLEKVKEIYEIKSRLLVAEKGVELLTKELAGLCSADLPYHTQLCAFIDENLLQDE